MINPKEVVKVIWVKGLQLTEEVLRDIRVIELEMREGKATTGSLTISDTEFKHTDSGYFRKNAELSMILGYSDYSEPFGPYVIKSIRYTAGEDAAPLLIVSFQDLSHKLHKKQKHKVDFGSCEEIIKKRAKEAGYPVVMVDPPKGVFTKSRPLVQSNKTDATIFRELADRYGYVWGIKGKTLYFRPPIGLDEIGEQKDVPVLSYRINDYSIMSVELEADFIRENGRSGAKKEVRNIPLDIQCKEEEDLYFNALRSGDTSNLPPWMAKSIPIGVLPSGNTAPDEDDAGLADLVQNSNLKGDLDKSLQGAFGSMGETLSQLADGVPGVQDALNKDTLNSVLNGVLPNIDSSTGSDKTAYTSEGWTGDSLKAVVDPSAGSIQTMPGSPAGTATPADPDEAKAQAAASWYRMVTVLKGTLVPSIPSVKYKPSQSVVLAGLGERLSGKYRITQVDLSFSDSGPIATTLQIEKKHYGPTEWDKKKIASGSSTSNPSIFNTDMPSSKDGTPKIADNNIDKVTYHGNETSDELGRKGWSVIPSSSKPTSE